MDFRDSRTEMLLLDSGAMVNIVGEEIANDVKVKKDVLRYKFKIITI